MMSHAQKPDFAFRAKRTSPFKSARCGAGCQFSPLLAARGVRISGSNAVYTVFRGSVKGTGYPIHSPVSPFTSLPCVNVCHDVSTGLYLITPSDTPVLCRTTPDSGQGELGRAPILENPKDEVFERYEKCPASGPPSL